MKTFIILQENRLTGEKTKFGEIKISFGDVGFVEFALKQNNANHKYELINKIQFNACKENYLTN